MKKEWERTRNGLDLRFIAFQTGSIQALFEPYHISNGFYSSSVRVLSEPYDAF
ncbi:hypothetical protein LEP1GSC038_0687 [Leptospira weilii str. 2006001855]|uniref:Uncharacterized protein n=1 Tax=Leptospira weilii str. 2006001855 TaxID=996804 RepID=M6FFB7_9LEPT|nr:hypothetical protein LEP1GSC038_0687 [Leptospira weilii str. 2006001855]